MKDSLLSFLISVSIVCLVFSPLPAKAETICTFIGPNITCVYDAGDSYKVGTWADFWRAGSVSSPYYTSSPIVQTFPDTSNLPQDAVDAIDVSIAALIDRLELDGLTKQVKLLKTLRTGLAAGVIAYSVFDDYDKGNLSGIALTTYEVAIGYVVGVMLFASGATAGSLVLNAVGTILVTTLVSQATQWALNYAATQAAQQFNQEVLQNGLIGFPLDIQVICLFQRSAGSNCSFDYNGGGGGGYTY